ncbi:hypothetical protein [Iningainema tapete]|uniref:Uncharacterized protein n=1 Tax=Iningainema tapete BLCC-T55 TaxID=2748662 RepID=A0A8J6XN38_9CYAN|nr:hypothetical protein [Iningainema tapete]MBD2774970.1 hypothetical protein [Iningainema tapete BLCC-T55]
MTEKFNLAANVMLSRRLKNLLRIDENVEIDISYITCAEYQLFIDEMLKVGKHRQPDHWTTDRFPPGDAKKPIVGVRGSYAEEFCKWLTQQHLAQDFRYRLPNLAEIQQIMVTQEAAQEFIRCWYREGENNIIELPQKQCKEHLAKICDTDIKGIHYLISLFDFNRILHIATKLQQSAYDFKHEEIIKFIRAIYSYDSNNFISAKLLSSVNDLWKNFDSTTALKLNHTFDQSKIAKVFHQAVTDVLLQIEKNTLNNLSKYPERLDNQRRINYESIRDAKLRLQLAEKHTIQTTEEIFIPIHSRDFIRELDWVEIESRLPEFVDELFELKSQGELVQYNIQRIPELKEDIKYIRTCEFALDETIADAKFREEELEKAKDRDEKLRDQIPHARNLLEVSHYYLLFICVLSNYLGKREFKEEILNLYLFCVLIDERRAGRLPSWEGIRIVRERI